MPFVLLRSILLKPWSNPVSQARIPAMRTSVVSLLVLITMVVAVSGLTYVNNYNNPARMYCPANRYMSAIFSFYSKKYYDRRWAFQCRPRRVFGCTWTAYVNAFNGLLAHYCPGDKIVTGIYSYHSNLYQDRRFKFRCCNVVGRRPIKCYYSGFTNAFQKAMRLLVRKEYAIKGATSCHDNKFQDRRWKFLLCELH